GEALEALDDRVGGLAVLASKLQGLAEVERLLANNLEGGGGRQDRVVLSSVHRAKGYQARKVFVADTGAIPLLRACRGCRGSGRSRGARCPGCNGRGHTSRPWEV